ncbi:hypothetical protein D3C85_1801070 [compost metagenome]
MDHGRPVASNHIPRVQPFMGTTVSWQPMPKAPLNMRAISPMVMPCRTGIG